MSTKKVDFFKKMEEFKKLAKNLCEMRKIYGLTQKQVAEKIGIKYQSYQAYERGIALPSLQNFVKLADLFDVSLDSLIGRKDI